MTGPISDLPRFPEPEKDPDRPPPRRRWSPVAVGLAALAATAGLVAAVLAFGDTEVRAVFLAAWLCLTYFGVRHSLHSPPDEEVPPRDE